MRHSNALKPFMTENVMQRQCFILFMRLTGESDEMFDFAHINEKWFYKNEVKQNFYHLPYERPLERATKRKRFITKVMFMVAVDRPRYDFYKKYCFD